MHIAATNGHVDTIRLLCKFGADARVLSNDGPTPRVEPSDPTCCAEDETLCGKKPLDVATERRVRVRQRRAWLLEQLGAQPIAVPAAEVFAAKPQVSVTALAAPPVLMMASAEVTAAHQTTTAVATALA